jgi:hypothetical protein
MDDGGYITACQTCWSPDLRPVLDLGFQPLAERDDGCRYPLGLQRCRTCGLVQLTYAVPREIVFPADHPYASGNTGALRGHFAGLAAEAAGLLDDGDLIIDIGSNDGTFLAAVRRRMPSARVRGVEPTGQAAAGEAKGVPAERAFFSYKLARALVRAYGHPRVVTACNVLAHAGDQHDFLSGVAHLLEGGGTFITENHAWSSVRAGQIDTVYHEHLRYYAPASLGYALAMHGMDVTAMEPVPTHGGSFRTRAVRDAGSLQPMAARVRSRLREIMTEAAGDGPVYGISAATRATPLIHFAGLARWLDRVVEVPGSARIGSRIPGTSVPVTPESDLIEHQPPHALLLCWHIAADVVPKLRAAGYQGKFIVPLPEAGYYRG